MMKNPPDGFMISLIDDSNIYEWKIIIEGPEGTDYAGGYFPAKLVFPKEFPNMPPDMYFTMPEFWHPNVYPDGKVCISILHPPEEDAMNELETMDEKWRPILSVEAILVSVVSMLSDANFSSPANIDASVMLKNEPKKVQKEDPKARETVARTYVR